MVDVGDISLQANSQHKSVVLYSSNKQDKLWQRLCRDENIVAMSMVLFIYYYYY